MELSHLSQIAEPGPYVWTKIYTYTHRFLPGTESFKPDGGTWAICMRDNLLYYTLKNKVCHLWWLGVICMNQDTHIYTQVSNLLRGTESFEPDGGTWDPSVPNFVQYRKWTLIVMYVYVCMHVCVYIARLHVCMCLYACMYVFCTIS
jgi:hypothetical protein